MPKEESKSIKALHAIAKVLYADTMQAEPFEELAEDEKAHYLYLAEQCMEQVRLVYNLDKAV